MADTQTAPDAPRAPIPSATELLARFADAEPNHPDRPSGTLSDLLDELGDAFVAYGQAFTASAATLRRHQPDMTVEAADLDAAGGGLSQAGWACRQLAPNLRGFLPPLPWLGEDAPIPPRPAAGTDRAASEEGEDEASADADTSTSPQGAAADAEDSPGSSTGDKHEPGGSA